MRQARRLSVENLETRNLLAASLGWDGPGLGSASLTYHIGTPPSGLDRVAVEGALKTALNAWSSVADIQFTPTATSGLPNSIDFSFRNLDGRGGTLAQAYFPDDVNPSRIAGDVQFDASERWEVGNALGGAAFDLVAVAVHEIGHALGLDHIAHAGSILLPSISANQSFVGLDNVDTQAIRELYAPAKPAVAVAPTTREAIPPVQTANRFQFDTLPRFRPPVWFESPVYWRNWFTAFSGFNWRGFGSSRIEVSPVSGMSEGRLPAADHMAWARPSHPTSFATHSMTSSPLTNVRDAFWEAYRAEAHEPLQASRPQRSSAGEMMPSSLHRNSPDANRDAGDRDASKGLEDQTSPRADLLRVDSPGTVSLRTKLPWLLRRIYS